MTMHLVRGMSSLNTRKHKAKSIATSEYEAEFREHNKQARRDNLPQLQFKTIDEYITYRKGTGVKVSKSKVFKPLNINKIHTRFIRETPVYQSKTSNVDIAGKVEPKQYSGNYMIGICQMTKSNAIPVFNLEHIKEIGHMRR